MSADIESIVLEKMRISEKFALQLDESTDISGYAQLLANVHFVDGDAIRENFLFCKALPEKTTGEEIFWVASEYLEQGGLTWENCVSALMEQRPWSGTRKGSLAVWRRDIQMLSLHTFFCTGATRCQDFTGRPGTCAGRCRVYDKLCKGKIAKKPHISISVWGNGSGA